jgi:hypothetical protein
MSETQQDDRLAVEVAKLGRHLKLKVADFVVV